MNDFLIKYTVLSSGSNGLSIVNNKSEDINGYIVSPCYFINNNEIVLPFNSDSLELCKPIFDEDGKCINSLETDVIFEIQEEAKRCASSLNSLLKAKYMIYAYREYYKDSCDLYHKKLNELTIKYNSNMRECNDIERNIFRICKDIIPIEEKEEIVTRKKRFFFKRR